LHNALHNAKIVQDTHKACEEDNCRQHLEGKYHTETTWFGRSLRECAENKLCPITCKTEKPHEELTTVAENLPANNGFHDEKCKGKLHYDANSNQFPINFFLIIGKNIGEGCNNDEAEETSEDWYEVHASPTLNTKWLKNLFEENIRNFFCQSSEMFCKKEERIVLMKIPEYI
jgi:hypothetical protein